MPGSRPGLVCALAALLLAACTSASPPRSPTPQDVSGAVEPGGAPAAVRPRERVRIAYAALAAPFAGSWMAQDAGLFEKYGLDVELSYVASGPTLLGAMIAGELDFGELAAPSPMNARLEGAEIVWIAGLVNRPIVFVIGAPDIARLDDLRGRNLGVTRIGTTSHTFTKLALRAAGLDPDRDVTVLQTGGLQETVAALVNGRISAAAIGPPASLFALQEGMHVVADLAQLGVAWPFAGTVATPATIAAHPERVRNYLRAQIEALHLLRTERERSIDVIARYSEATDRRVAEQAWELLQPHYALPPYPDRTALETVVREELLLTNPRARDLPLEAYYDDRFVRELDESGFVREVTGR